MVEFALVLPILLFLLFGIIEFSRLFYSWIVVENVARVGVRYATTGEYNPAYCVDGPDAGTEACAGDGKADEIDKARIPSIKDEVRRLTIGFPYNESLAQSDEYYYKITICSNKPGEIFVLPEMGGPRYSDCTPEEDPGAPGQRVVVSVDYNFAYIIPLLKGLGPVVHLAAYREGIVEQFRVSRLINIQPTFAVPTVPTNTPLPTATFTATPLPSPTATCAPLFVDIISPGADGVEITDRSQTDFEAVAYDPNIGTNNGDGIFQVHFTLFDPNGNQIHYQSESLVAYCGFGGDHPCSWMPTSEWDALINGTYTLQAEAISYGSCSSTAITTKTFNINNPPTPTPTITLTPSKTPTPTLTPAHATTGTVPSPPDPKTTHVADPRHSPARRRPPALPSMRWRCSS
jgi:hypothetical protein